MTILRTVGAGTSKVLVLPGLFGANMAFDAMLEYADCERFQYVVVEYRGYGTAKNDLGLYSLREIVTDVVRLLDYLGWVKVHLIGHSAGALAAQMIAVATPARAVSITSLAGVSAGGLRGDSSRIRVLSDAASDLEKRAAVMHGGTGQRYCAGFTKSLSAHSEGKILPLALRSYAQDAAATDIQTQVEGSRIPFLAVVGRHDPGNTESIARETTLRLYPHAQIEVIDSGHYPMNECPALTMSLIERFHTGIDKTVA
jgi:pimeloyl-ACP methyl ester carboxylesterase